VRLEVLRHLVERLRQVAELVARSHRHARLQVSLGDLAHAAAQRP
jgi:hypothetical protein